jgi:hypothetical protein
MRTLRSAFVVTLTAAACTRNAPPTEEPHRNPPALPVPDVAMLPHNPPGPVCPPREALHDGEACTAPGLDCYMPTGGCQPSGFQCREGRWHEVMVTCNPPMPQPSR